MTYSFTASTVQPLKFGKGQIISFQTLHTLLGMWLIIHIRIKVTMIIKEASGIHGTEKYIVQLSVKCNYLSIPYAICWYLEVGIWSEQNTWNENRIQL